MVDACEKAGRKLMIAYRIHYEPHHRMMMDWIRSKKYGKVKLIEMFNGQNTGDPTQIAFEKGFIGRRFFMEAFYQSAKEGKPVKLERITTLDTFRGTPPKNT